MTDMDSSLRDLVGKTGLEVMNGSLDPDRIAEADRMARAGRPWLGDVDRLWPDGSTRRVELRATPRFDASGSLEGTVTVVRDVTDLRAAETALALEAQVRIALADSLHGIPEDASVADAAQAICDQLVTLPFVDLAAIEAFLGPTDVQILAQSAPPGYPVPVGTFLPPARAGAVRERAAGGPWAQYVTRDSTNGLDRRRRRDRPEGNRLRPDRANIGLVRGVNANLGRQAMVVGMRHFSRTAGCRLIAEGIETKEEARTLTGLGVEYGQGYLFGRPEPVEVWAPGSAGSTPAAWHLTIVPARDAATGRVGQSRLRTPSIPANRAAVRDRTGRTVGQPVPAVSPPRW